MELFSGDRPPVVLAGAGLSAPPPTCLPGWWSVNDAVLQALGDALEHVIGKPGFADSFRTVVVDRRDSTPFLKPDLQAQLIEDEIGDAYFRALAHLDSPHFNEAHAVIAELARLGRLSAIITTNFDCTIETALQAAGVPYTCYASPDEFEALSGHSHGVPVVKPHGSAIRPSTMIDTLRQRLHGRPKALTDWMHGQFARSLTLALGFSGEDLQYQRQYLSIRPALADGARFRFLVRAGTKPSVPIRELAADFPGRVLFDEGELPYWLLDAARGEGIQPLPAEDDILAEEADAIRLRSKSAFMDGLAQWTSTLTAMDILNAVTALLTAAGRRSVAFGLLERTWEFYRGPEDAQGAAYARYLSNYGETLMRQARFRNQASWERDFLSWREVADHDPRQFFMRAVERGGSVDARSRKLLCDFLAGRPTSAITPEMTLVLDEMSEQERNGTLSVTVVDACFSLAELLELLAHGAAGTAILEFAHHAAAQMGDEFRRAEAAWRLARNLSFDVHADAAVRQRVAGLTTECRGIAERLDIRESDAGAALACSIEAGTREDWTEAALQAARAETIYTEVGDVLSAVAAKRERVRALVGQLLETGRMDAVEFDELSESLQRFAVDQAPGLGPTISFELALAASHFDEEPELAAELARDAVEDAERRGHEGVRLMALDLLRALEERGE